MPRLPEVQPPPIRSSERNPDQGWHESRPFRTPDFRIRTPRAVAEHPEVHLFQLFQATGEGPPPRGLHRRQRGRHQHRTARGVRERSGCGPVRTVSSADGVNAQSAPAGGPAATASTAFGGEPPPERTEPRTAPGRPPQAGHRVHRRPATPKRHAGPDVAGRGLHRYGPSCGKGLTLGRGRARLRARKALPSCGACPARNQPPEVSSSASAPMPAQSYGSFSQPSGRTTRLLPEVRPRGPSAPSGQGWSRSSSCS